MGKIYFLVDWADKAFRRLPEYFDHETVFGPSTYNPLSGCEDEFIEVSGEDQDKGKVQTGQFKFLLFWNLMLFWFYYFLKSLMMKKVWDCNHFFMVQEERVIGIPLCWTAWALCLQPKIWKDCLEQMSVKKGHLRKMIDRVIIHIHEPPCLNKRVLFNT